MKKWFHLRVALALLGAIVIHLILWPIYCCAGSPIRNLHFANNENKMNLSAVDDSHHQTNNSNRNSSYEISTNNNVAHSFKNYLHVSQSMDENSNESIMDKNNIIEVDRYIRNNEKEHNNNSRITSSIYDIFLINSEQKMKETSRTLMRNDRSANQYHLNGKHKKLNGTKRVKSNSRVKASTLERNERSANLSHITGSARKIQMYILNRFLQLMPDGTVNSTTDEFNDYSKFLFYFLK